MTCEEHIRCYDLVGYWLAELNEVEWGGCGRAPIDIVMPPPPILSMPFVLCSVFYFAVIFYISLIVFRFFL